MYPDEDFVYDLSEITLKNKLVAELMKADIPPLWDLCMATPGEFHVVFVLGIGFEHKAHDPGDTTMWSCHGHGPYSKKNTLVNGWVEKGVRDACEVICSFLYGGVDLDVLGRFKLRTSKEFLQNTTIK
ncbi:hypothetical protein SPFM15_00169 [Salmonella phage SPFM15]|nr:hypothetical protein SPFM5_00164 [Salmonella phage SPFM5]VFR13793.1 hypothetical protein SPFM15_00169 [Salmonella phage SPFM15]